MLVRRRTETQRQSPATTACSSPPPQTQGSLRRLSPQAPGGAVSAAGFRGALCRPRSSALPVLTGKKPLSSNYENVDVSTYCLFCVGVIPRIAISIQPFLWPSNLLTPQQMKSCLHLPLNA